MVVLGMHRSGTSLLAAMLAELGVDMGEDAFGATAFNPTGHFEDEQFVHINNKLLKTAGGSWALPPAVGSILEASQKLTVEIQSSLENRPDLFGFKDPRTCLTLQAWFTYLKTPYFIICNRSKDSVARSLKERNGWSLERGLMLCDQYESRIKDIKEQYPTIPCFELEYTELLKSPVDILSQIQAFLKLPDDGSAVQRASRLVVSRKTIKKVKRKHMLKQAVCHPYKILPFFIGRCAVIFKRLKGGV